MHSIPRRAASSLSFMKGRSLDTLANFTGPEIQGLLAASADLKQQLRGKQVQHQPLVRQVFKLCLRSQRVL